MGSPKQKKTRPLRPKTPAARKTKASAGRKADPQSPGAESIVITFNPKLYTAPALEETASAFADWAEVTVSSTRTGFQVTLRPKSPDDAGVLADEFANYALSRTIAARR